MFYNFYMNLKMDALKETGSSILDPNDDSEIV